MNNKDKKTHAAMISGYCAGMMKTIVGHPFDTVKVRMQTTNAARFQGPLECLLQTVRIEGVRGLYKGLASPMLGTGFTDSVMFTSVSITQRVLRKELEIEKLQLRHNMFAGLVGGLVSSLVVCPVEQVKARLQVQYEVEKSQRLYKGPIDVIRQLIRNNGVLGLWKGLAGTMLFRVHNSIYIGSYEYYRIGLTNYVPSINDSLRSFICGGLAATTVWAIAYPSDVAKNRMMSQPDVQPRKYETLRGCFKSLYQEGGIRIFYRGYLPCLLRSFPANGASLLTFETVNKIFHKYDL